MKIGDLTSASVGAQFKILQPEVEAGDDKFKNVLSELIDNVKESQNEAADLTKKYVLGEDVELHEVMIAGEKAKTSFQLLMEIRNKTVDMYKELTKISV
jgi:flagellar hook-basal body complex protein FliE